MNVVVNVACVPVVSTRISGIPELVIHERTGLLCEPDDPAGLARAINRLIDTPELAKTLSDAARAHVLLEFGPSQNLDRLVAQFALDVPTPRFEPSRATL